MFTIKADKYQEGTYHVGRNGNLYSSQSGKWVVREERDLTKLIELTLNNATLSSSEKINRITELPSHVGCNFFGSCQYYSAWQV
jgi:hypothetical protein